MKSFVRVAAVGFTGVVLFKFLAMPLFGMMLGLIAMTMKFALIAAVGYFIYSMFLKCREKCEVEVEEEIEEVEVIIEE